MGSRVAVFSPAPAPVLANLEEHFSPALFLLLRGRVSGSLGHCVVDSAFVVGLTARQAGQTVPFAIP